MSALHGKDAVAPIMDRIRDQQDESHSIVHGKKYESYFWSDFLAKYPSVICFVTILPFFIVSIVFALTDPRYSTAVDSFINTDAFTVKHWDAVQAAQEQWSNIRRYGSAAATVSAELGKPTTRRHNIAYRVEVIAKIRHDVIAKEILNGSTFSNSHEILTAFNLLREGGVDLLRQLEQKIIEMPQYQNLCWRSLIKHGKVEASDDPNLPACSPMNSVTTYFFPGELQNGQFDFSGQGTVYQRPALSVLQSFLQNPLHGWFVNHGFSPEMPETHILRTQITLGWPAEDGSLPGTPAYESSVDDLLLKMWASVGDWRHPAFDLSIGSPRMEETFVQRGLDSDRPLFAATVVIICFFLCVQARSVFIGMASTLQLFVTVMTTFYATMEERQLPLVSTMLVFIAAAFGCDSIMTYNASFNHSGSMPTTGRDNTLSVSQRVAFTFRHGVQSILMANFMAIVAFACVTAIPIPAIKDFAVAAIVMLIFNCIMVVFFQPALNLVYHYHVSTHRRNAQRKIDVANRLRNNQRMHPVHRVALEDIHTQRTLPDNVPLSTMRANADKISFQLKQINEPAGMVGARKGFDVAMQDRREIQQMMAGLGTYDALNNAADKAMVDGRANGVTLNGTQNALGASFEDFPEANRDLNISMEHFPEASAVQTSTSGTFGGGGLRASASGGFEKMNKRRVPDDRVVHIPRELCYPTEENFKRSSEAVISSYGESVPVETINGDLNLPSVDETGSGSRGYGSSPAMNNADENDEGIQQQQQQSTLRSVRVAEERELQRFGSRWQAVADKLNFEAEQTVFPYVRGFVAHSLVAVQMGYSILYPDDPVVRSPTRLSGRTPTQLAAPVGQPNTDQQLPWLERVLIMPARQRIINWRHGRQHRRQFCCGLVGKRVGESREEKDRRIMGKKQKKWSHSKLERLFYNKWAPFVHAIRYATIPIALILIVVFAFYAAELSVSTKKVQLADYPRIVDEYESDKKGFASQGHCDYCGAYFRPLTEFPQLSVSAANTCAAQGHIPMITSWVDRCGVCYGDNDCFDCKGEPISGQRNNLVDFCGQCLPRGDLRFDSCSDCNQNKALIPSLHMCWPCYGITGQLYRAGNECSALCTPTSCSNGECDPYTGECTCYEDDQRGYWDNDPSGQQFIPPRLCTKCRPGFFGEKCTKSCTTSTDTCSCVDERCHCTNSPFIGDGCQLVRRRSCLHGTIVSSACKCDDGWGGEHCDRSLQCSLRGVHYDAAVVPAGHAGCKCMNQAYGKSCELCLCYNGGYCDNDGKCICVGGWTGFDCRACPRSCYRSGTCPLEWTPKMYSEFDCRVLFCPSGGDCPQCANDGCRQLQGNATGNVTVACNAEARCSTDVDGVCRGAVPEQRPSDVYQYCSNCPGYLTGPKCDTCDNKFGLSCNEKGELVGCDGVAAKLGKRPATIDGCGVCGGSGTCTGCDGINPNSKFDSCGVCGGDNICTFLLDHLVAPTVPITLMIGVRPRGEDGIPYGAATLDPSFDITDTRTQTTIYMLCNALAISGGIRVSTLRCPMTAFSNWLHQPNVVQRFGIVNFPVPPGTMVSSAATGELTFAQFLYVFAQEEGYTGDIGFTSSTSDSSLGVTFIRVDAKTQLLATVTDESLVAILQLVDDVITQAFADIVSTEPSSVVSLSIVLGSEQVTKAFSRVSALRGTAFAIGLTMYFYTVMLLVLTCSILVTIPGVVCIGGIVACTTGSLKLGGWEIGPAELASISVVCAFAGQQIVHQGLGYVAYLHGSRSNLFATELSRLQAYRGMLLRSGVPLFVSCFAVVFACIPFLAGASVYIFQKVAVTMAIAMAWSLVWSLVLFGGMLCALGPTSSYRVPFIAGVLLVGCGVVTAIVALAIHAAGGILDPSGNYFLGS